MQMSPELMFANIIQPVFHQIGETQIHLAVFLTSIHCATGQSNHASLVDQSALDHPLYEALCYGPFQMTHEQHWLIWENYLSKDPELASKTRGLASQHHFLLNPDAELNLNWGYATAVAVLWIRFRAKSFTKSNNISPMLDYWNDEFLHHGSFNKFQFFEIYQRLSLHLKLNAA